MKILYVTDAFPPFGFGAQVSTSLIVEALSKKNQCIVLTSNLKEKSWNFGKVTVHPILKGIAQKKRTLYNALSYSFRILFYLPYNLYKTKKFIKAYNPDIVNVVSTSHHLFPSVIASISEKKPTIIDIRGGSLNCPKRSSTRFYNKNKNSCEYKCFKCLCSPEVPRSKFIEFLRPFIVAYELLIFNFWTNLLKYNMKNITFFVPNSNFVKDQLVTDGVPKEKVRVIYNICKLKNSKRGKNKRKNVIIFAGRLEKEKGIWDAIEAFELLNDKKLIFKIVGEGSEYDKVIDYIHKNKLKNIKILGKKLNKEVSKLYKESKVILGPSIIPEAFGRYILESISARTPLITTPVGGNMEGVKHRKTGILIEPSNPEQLAKAIRGLLKNKRLYNRIVKNLEKEALKYSPDRIGKQRLRLYNEAISKNKESLFS